MDKLIKKDKVKIDKMMNELIRKDIPRDKKLEKCAKAMTKEKKEMIVIVKVSDSEKTLRQEFVYLGKNLTISHECDVLKNYVDDVLNQFKGTAEDILVTVKMDW